MTTDTTEAVNLATAFVGEALVPGGANLVRGDFGQAGLHLALGFAARAVFGLPGLALVSADSLVRATTGRSLPDHLGIAFPKISFAPPATPHTATPPIDA